MKKLLIIIALLFTAVSHGQLNAEAKVLAASEQFQKDYNIIKTNAQERWGSDYEMVVYEINKQSKALFRLLDLIKQVEEGDVEYDILVDALARWEYDYEMVVYEYEKQVEALRSL